MSTIVEQALERAVNEKMADPEWVVTIADYLAKLQSGFFDEWYCQIICQKWEGRPDYSIYDAYAFANVHAWLTTGEIAVAKVSIGEEPCSDNLVEEMNRRLGKLWPPFSAKFWGGTQGADGMFLVEEPVDFSVNRQDKDETLKMKFFGHFPLKVGYIGAGKTMVYMNSNLGRLARWPYGSKEIILLARVSPLPSAVESILYASEEAV